MTSSGRLTGALSIFALHELLSGALVGAMDGLALVWLSQKPPWLVREDSRG